MKSGVYLNFSSRKTIKNDNAVVKCTLPLSMLTISQLAEVKQHCYSNFFLRGGAATPPTPPLDPPLLEDQIRFRFICS